MAQNPDEREREKERERFEDYREIKHSECDLKLIYGLLTK